MFVKFSHGLFSIQSNQGSIVRVFGWRSVLIVHITAVLSLWSVRAYAAACVELTNPDDCTGVEFIDPIDYDLDDACSNSETHFYSVDGNCSGVVYQVDLCTSCFNNTSLVRTSYNVGQCEIRDFVECNKYNCQNCSSSNWAVNGNTTETMTEATCNSSTGYECKRTTKYRCRANYYSATGKSSATVVTDLNCTACPNGKTSLAGSTSLDACTGGSSGSQTCTASENCGSWTKNGIYEVQSCNRVSTNCSKTTTSKYRCAAGYYAANTQSGGVSSNQNGLNCTRCPKIDNVQSKSNAGGVGKGACCINQGDEGEDDSGPFVIESKCCAS